MLSNFAFMLGMSSMIGLNSARMASISAPTSVTVNLPVFLACFFIVNIIIERHFSVKQKIKKAVKNVQ